MSETRLYRCVACWTVYAALPTDDVPESWYCHCGYRIDPLPTPTDPTP